MQHTREAQPAGDYAIRAASGELPASVERKTLENLATCLSDGSLVFQLTRLAELPLAGLGRGDWNVAPFRRPPSISV